MFWWLKRNAIFKSSQLKLSFKLNFVLRLLFFFFSFLETVYSQNLCLVQTVVKQWADPSHPLIISLCFWDKLAFPVILALGIVVCSWVPDHRWQKESRFTLSDWVCLRSAWQFLFKVLSAQAIIAAAPVSFFLPVKAFCAYGFLWYTELWISFVCKADCRTLHVNTTTHFLHGNLLPKPEWIFLLINVKIDISFCLNHLTAHNLLSNLANLKKIG